MTDLEQLLTDHFQGWADKMTAEQARALIDWQSPRHAILNNLLRARSREPASVGALIEKLGESTAEELLQAANHLAEACGQELLPCDVTVFRGINRDGYLGILRTMGMSDLRPGDVIFDAGFVATSLHEKFATSRMGDPGDALLLELFIACGTPCAWLPAFITSPDQGELLLAPPVTSRIVSVTPMGQDRRATADVRL